MKKIIYCTYLKKKSESLKFQPYPGKIGEKIYKNISRVAWLEWKKRQTIIINEKKLNMGNIHHRQMLEKEMIYFLFKK